MSSAVNDARAPHAVPAKATEVSPGVFAYVQHDGTWWVNNAGFVTGSHGVIAIDTCATTSRTQALIRSISAVSSAPVRTVINTHHHGDHTFGNYLFPAATIVGHEKVRESIAQWGRPRSDPYWTAVEWGPIELAPPFLTFRDSISIYSDDLLCEVRHVGTPAHTTNDSIVWLPERKVLFSGDLLFNGGTPFLVQGSLSGALRALDYLRELQAEVIVPGHGPIAGPELIDKVEHYVRFVLTCAQEGRAAGLSPLELARSVDLGQFAQLSDPERLVGNLHRAYSELAGEPPGTPIDAAAALADMVEFNGGKPLTCRA